MRPFIYCITVRNGKNLQLREVLQMRVEHPKFTGTVMHAPIENFDFDPHDKIRMCCLARSLQARSQQWKLNNNKELISFDVISLFTWIPTDLALHVALNRMENDPILSKRKDIAYASRYY